MTATADYYSRLGIEPNATVVEIKKAFRALARKFHPDVAKDKKKGEEQFKAINEAYETLSDEDKRRAYDEELKGKSQTTYTYTYNKANPYDAYTAQAAPKPKRNFHFKRAASFIFLLVVLYEIWGAHDLFKKLHLLSSSSRSTVDTVVAEMLNSEHATASTAESLTAKASQLFASVEAKTVNTFKKPTLDLKGVTTGPHKLATINNRVLGEGESTTFMLGHSVTVTCLIINDDNVLVTIDGEKTWLFYPDKTKDFASVCMR